MLTLEMVAAAPVGQAPLTTSGDTSQYGSTPPEAHAPDLVLPEAHGVLVQMR